MDSGPNKLVVLEFGQIEHLQEGRLCPVHVASETRNGGGPGLSEVTVHRLSVDVEDTARPEVNNASFALAFEMREKVVRAHRRWTSVFLVEVNAAGTAVEREIEDRVGPMASLDPFAQVESQLALGSNIPMDERNPQWGLSQEFQHGLHRGLLLQGSIPFANLQTVDSLSSRHSQMMNTEAVSRKHDFPSLTCPSTQLNSFDPKRS